MIVSSVVPTLTNGYRQLALKYLDHPAVVVGPGIRTGMSLAIDNPVELGADRLVNAVAAYRRYGGPCIVVDLGTATTLDVVSDAGVYLGGVIAPGMETSLDALTSRAARLVKVDLIPPERIIGRSTVESMRSGLVLGTVAMIDGLCAQIREELHRDDHGDRHRRPVGDGRQAVDPDRPHRSDAHAGRLADDLQPERHGPPVAPRRRGVAVRKRMKGPIADRTAGGAAVAVPGDGWPLAEPFVIGDLVVPNRVLQAPLAGIANAPFRLQAQRHGAGLSVSEMVASMGVHHGNARTVDMLRLDPAERLTGIQLFGAVPDGHGRGGPRGGGERCGRSSTSTWAVRSRRSARPARARRCWPTRAMRPRSSPPAWPPSGSRSPSRSAGG